MTKDSAPKIDYERHTLRGRPRRFVRAGFLKFFGLTIGMRLVGVERVRAVGGVLVVSNHLHNADPILINGAYPRPLHYMAKKEVFDIPLLPWLLRFVGAFPVDRGKSDRNAIRRAQALLAAGIAVGMFPEGTRSVTRSLQKAHPGVGLLALSGGCSVQPVVITGSEYLPFNGSKGRAKASIPGQQAAHEGVRVLFGEPFTVPREIDGRRVGSEEAADIIMQRIAEMLPPSYRGVYAAGAQAPASTLGSATIRDG
jgi:1-acyl-sn-glycerol-3-phosphate acyltransferase